MPDVDRRLRLIEWVTIVLGAGLLIGGLFAESYHYTYRSSIVPAFAFEIYPYRDHAFPMIVGGCLVLAAGIVISAWAWGRQP